MGHRGGNNWAGVSDRWDVQGFGDAIVMSRVTKKSMGAIESTLVEDFRRFLRDDLVILKYNLT